ncbi:membrane-associated protein, putative [Bodo saltans]|uniref:Membrane-associated protein, putative n=1 Tax=Bodo saltans TaxID=75058 RepID=A0A0S4IZT8_BODSA|nr:membrane-associated protein, putative [Bodo saltans]|eukprot:CUG24871.1 membrane-associated protein, putative [Bodo saltans]
MPFAVFLLSLTVMMGWGTAFLASAQGSAATPVQDYYPVGGLSQPNSVTASPNAYVGPIPPTPVLGTFPPTPAPAGGVGSPAVMESGARLRSRVDITCTFFHEDKVPEYQEILTSLAFQWLVGQSSNHSALLYKGLKQILADYQYVLGSTTTAFTPDAVYSTSLDVMLRRLVPLRTLSLVGRGGGPGGGSPSSTSVSQRAQPIAMDYGVYSVASFVLLPLTNTTLSSLGLTPVSITGGSDGDSPLNFQYPFAAQKTSSLSQNATLVRRLIAATQVATAPTLETDYLCEAFAASFAELILSQPRERLTTLSSPSAWLLSGIVDVRCPRLLTRLPVTGTVGVNVLWIVFIVMGICCLSGAAYALFWRTRSDQDVDINADEKEKVATAIRNGLSAKELPPATKGFMSSSDDEGQQQERAQRQRANSTMQQRQRSPRSGDDEADDGNDLASRIDSKTESIHEIRSSRNQLLDKRKSLRIRDLVAKALTGDSTIYGASEEEREMVAMILKNPRFDGGRLQFDSEASPVEVVLNNDRLFLLPPTDIRLSTKVQGKYHKGQGRVTSVTFPVSVEQDGSIGGAAGGGGTSSSGRNMFLEDVVSAGSLSAQMAAAQADAQQKKNRWWRWDFIQRTEYVLGGCCVGGLSLRANGCSTSGCSAAPAYQ